ncbi:hypothetical protein BHE74_00027062 [Ensete ventricosum]|nr:hypothetical protein BHE74_00027062 [Ensete ventricosum]
MGIIHTRYNRPREGRTQERTVLFLRQSLTYIVITNIATFAAKIVGTSHGHHRSSRCRCGRGGGFPRAGGGAATGCGVSSSIGWASPPSPRHGCNLASSSLAAADALSFPIPSPTKKWLWLRVEEKGSEDLVGRETAGGGGGGGGTGEHRVYLKVNRGWLWLSKPTLNDTVLVKKIKRGRLHTLAVNQELADLGQHGPEEGQQQFLAVSQRSDRSVRSSLGKQLSDSNMKKVKSTKQRQQNGHALPSKFAKLLDPEASWDKVRTRASRGVVLFLLRINWGMFCTGSGRCWASRVDCCGAPFPWSVLSGLLCKFRGSPSQMSC